jgi:hypothetical protein
MIHERNKMTNPHDTKIHTAMRALAAECGFDNSESGSERFMLLLLSVAKQANSDTKRSHKSGLCMDCYTAMASDLAEAVGAMPYYSLN